MNDKLTLFNYQDKEVRTITINDEIWFILVDVCKILDISNIDYVRSTLDNDDLRSTRGPELGIRTGKVNLINESGLYQVIFQSRKPEAKAFKRWITKEVLPSIRKTGSYSVIPIQLPYALLVQEEYKRVSYSEFTKVFIILYIYKFNNLRRDLWII